MRCCKNFMENSWKIAKASHLTADNPSYFIYIGLMKLPKII